VTDEQEVKSGQEKSAPAVEEAGEAPAEVPAESVVPEEGETAQEVEGEVADDLETLCQQLEEVRAKEAEYLDGWQRARAELANARKRFQRDQQGAYANAKADILVRLLPIIDDFERAFADLPDELSDHTWVQGIKLIQQKAQGILTQESVEPIEAAGQEFDPLWHQAVTHEPSEEVPEGQVIGEMQKGYSIGDRVLRPSMVRVSSGPPPKPEPEEEPGQAGQDPGAEEGTGSAEQES
jgi:molecular chaperone GrpE